MKEKTKHGFLKSFAFAANGVKLAFRQRNFRIQAGCAFVAVAAGSFFGITSAEWLAVILLIALVLSLEIVNTALESVVDLVTGEWKPLAGKIKDLGAGAVLVASLFAAVGGVLIFFKYFIAWLRL